MFKDVVRLTQNDEFYLVTDTESNIRHHMFLESN